MCGSEPIRVAIVDDDGAFADALSRIIGGAEGFVCAGTFGSIEEALPALPSARPNVLLLDLQLPGMPGDQAIELIRSACPGAAILVLTIFSDRARVFASICNGASGYLLKSTPPLQLLEAIRSAQAGGAPISPEIARQNIGVFQTTAGPPPVADLTAQEKRALGLLAEGYSYQATADRMHVSVNTMRNYVRAIYEKLHAHSKSEAVSKALRRGVI
jgi:DNA-binding NarL/FixJ family response regulator